MLKVESCATSPEPCSAISSGMVGASLEGFLQQVGRHLCSQRCPLSVGTSKLLAMLKGLISYKRILGLV